MREDMSKTGNAILVYTLVFMFLASLIATCFEGETIELLAELIAALAAALLIFVALRSDIDWNDILAYGEKKMTVGFFIVSIFALFAAQLLSSVLDLGMETVLNMVGMSIEEQVEAATGEGTKPIEMLYVGIAAPILEELLFRGLAVQRLKKYGKNFAIFASAFLFGVYHANLPQGCFAFMVGILFAYIALEYSIYWSILLHIFNNTNIVFSDWLAKYFQTEIFDYISTFLYLLSLPVTVIVLLKNRSHIRQYFRVNHSKSGSISCFFHSAAILLFIILNAGVAILDIILS